VTDDTRQLRGPCAEPDSKGAACGVLRDMRCPFCDAPLCFRCARGHDCAIDDEPQHGAAGAPGDTPSSQGVLPLLGDYRQAPEPEGEGAWLCEECSRPSTGDSPDKTWIDASNRYMVLCGPCAEDLCRVDSTT